MSYILDALRRADAERERGTLPGLHTQAVPAGSVDPDVDKRPRPWAWMVAAAFAALLGLVAWLMWERSDPTDAAVATAAAPVPAAASVAAVSAAAPLPAAAIALPAAPTVAPALAVATASAASATAAREPSAGSRKPAPAVAAAPLRKPSASSAAPTTAAATPAAKTEPAAKAAEPATRVPSLVELPEEVRRGLPGITVGGSIYSKSAANRMLVINGQVFHEGDELMPGLALEQIKQKAAVLNFKGFRYEVGF